MLFQRELCQSQGVDFGISPAISRKVGEDKTPHDPVDALGLDVTFVERWWHGSGRLALLGWTERQSL